jgi:hypothetical protein
MVLILASSLANTHFIVAGIADDTFIPYLVVCFICISYRMQKPDIDIFAATKDTSII